MIDFIWVGNNACRGIFWVKYIQLWHESLEICFSRIVIHHIIKKTPRQPVKREIYLKAFGFSKEEFTLQLISKRKLNRAEKQITGKVTTELGDNSNLAIKLKSLFPTLLFKCRNIAIGLLVLVMNVSKILHLISHFQPELGENKPKLLQKP